ncbi:hypothetical protein KC367_g98 [Hortaea werneckii]|nr:hypothetical protein KC367_g98 [Hortaea werneckii]
MTAVHYVSRLLPLSLPRAPRQLPNGSQRFPSITRPWWLKGGFRVGDRELREQQQDQLINTTAESRRIMY